MPGIETLSASIRGTDAVVASADQLASQAAMATFSRGGNAVDAAISANAVLSVTAPHLCGMGGDLFALVHTGRSVVGLNASGRAGSGSDAAGMRAQGLTAMPFRHDPRSVTVPGCVDGWLTLHARLGHLAFGEILAPAIRLAEHGFPASPLLVGSLATLDERGRRSLGELADQANRSGARVRRPGVARTLRAIVDSGRDGFYTGEFGIGLVRLGGGVFSDDDLRVDNAEWVEPLRAEAFGVDLYTIGPNSQGYLALGAARLADRIGLPDDPHDPRWAHVLAECSRAAGRDRPDVLHDRADGQALLDAIDTRVDEINVERATPGPLPVLDGDTTYLCTADHHGMAVSLIQSNASGFGSWLVEDRTGINVHNRGLGFSLAEGHPAELAPGRRPPHTLCPALATRNGELAAVFGTMGGDAQPQILLQVAARLFHHGQGPAVAVNSGRWAWRGPVTGFDTWTAPEGPLLNVEGHAPEQWADGLTARGHRVETRPAFDSGFGHAHAIVVESDGMFAAAADARTRIGAAAAL